MPANGVKVVLLRLDRLDAAEVPARPGADRLYRLQLAALGLQLVDSVHQPGEQLRVAGMNEEDPVLLVLLARGALAVDEHHGIAQDVVPDLLRRDPQFLEDRLERLLELLRLRRILELLEQR